MSAGIFITGTDTGVGKTRVAAMLVRAMRAAGIDAVGFKPICCGGREDAELLHAAGGGVTALNDVNPVWLRPPLAPHAAAMIEGRAVDVALVRKKFAQLRAAHAAVVVEGVGGWMVPVARDLFMADLAREFALPVVIIAANRLGSLNHTLLTVAVVKASGLPCAGVILNHPLPVASDDAAALTNAAVLEDVLDVPLLGTIDFGAEDLPAALGARLLPPT